MYKISQRLPQLRRLFSTQVKKKLSFDRFSPEVRDWRQWMFACKANGGSFDWTVMDEYELHLQFCKDDDDVRIVMQQFGENDEVREHILESEKADPTYAKKIETFRKVDAEFRKRFG